MIGVVAARELVDLREGDAFQWKAVHTLLLRDEPVLQMVKADCVYDVAQLGFPPEQIRTFVFDRAYLLAVARRRTQTFAGEFIYDPEDSVLPNMGAVVAVGQRPLPVCATCGAVSRHPLLRCADHPHARG